MKKDVAKEAPGLSLPQLFNLGFGTMIGVGWITVFGDLLGQAGSFGVAAAFLVGGLLVCLVGLCYAELGGLYPVSGGEIVYAHMSFGPRGAFIAGWLLIFSYIAVTAFEAISVVWILSHFVPEIDGEVLYQAFGTDVHLGTVLFGIGGTVLLGWLNFRGAVLAARLQTVMTYALILVSFIFIIVAIVNGKTENLRPMFGSVADPDNWYGIFPVLITTPFFFAGFNVISQAMGEASGSDLGIRAGRTILLSIAGAALFYAMIFISASMVLPRTELIALDLPAAGAFAAAFSSPLGGDVVLFAGLLGLLTTWNAVIFSAARVFQTFGRAGILGKDFARLHPRYQTPHVGILVVVALSALLVLLGQGAVLPIINSVAACFSLLFAMSAFSFLLLRAREPDLPRPFRVRYGPAVGWGAALLSIAMTGLSFQQQFAASPYPVPLEWVLLAIWFLSGAALWRSRRKILSSLSNDDMKVRLLASVPMSDECETSKRIKTDDAV